LISSGCILSAHDLSEGGLFTALCESGFYTSLGFSINTTSEIRKDAFLFGESQSRVLVTVPANAVEKFEEVVHSFPHMQAGKVTPGKIEIDGENWGMIEEWQKMYDTAIENQLDKELTSEGALGML